MLVDDIAHVPALREMGPEPLGAAFSLAFLERVIEEKTGHAVTPAAQAAAVAWFIKWLRP